MARNVVQGHRRGVQLEARGGDESARYDSAVGRIEVK